jgi:hypothetical protein
MTPITDLYDLFAALPSPPDPVGLYPDYAELKNRFLTALDGDDEMATEEAFLALYCHVHGHEAPYTTVERARVNETGGYWAHAGGVSPILRAGAHIRPDTVLGDFGAGNGLQALLMQRLHPHEKTIQIEISSKMVEAGRALVDWLGVPAERVEWIVGDVLDHSPAGMDFVYLYRPVRPTGEGRAFYETFAAEIGRGVSEAIVFSIADCLGEFLPTSYQVFFSDGHLTCYRGPGR